MKWNEGRYGLGIVVGFVLLMSMFSLRVIPTPATAAIDAQWTPAFPLNDTRSEAVVVMDDAGLVYVIGGMNNSLYVTVNNVSSYDPDTGVWKDLAPLPQLTRGAAGVYLDGKIYVFAGYTGSVFLQNTQIYDIATNTWSSGTSIPQALWEAKAGVGSNGLIYVFGGKPTGVTFSSGVHIYDPSTDLWDTGLDMPVATAEGAVVSDGYALYYIGGFTSLGVTNAVNVYYTWDSWDSLAPLPRATTALAAVMGADSLLYAFGGATSETEFSASLNWTYHYNTWKDVWDNGPNMTMSSKYLAGASTADGRILAIGGVNATAVFKNVDSMRVMSVSTSVSPTTVQTGRSIVVTVSVDFANAVPEAYYGSAVLVSGSGTSFSAVPFQGTFDATFAFQMVIPEGITAGAYTVDMANINIEYKSGGTTLPEQKLSLAVVVGDTLDEQMQSLMDEIANLQEQLAQDQQNITALVQQMTILLTALGGLQNQVDRIEKKADNAVTYGMISVVLVIVILVLLALLLMMSRKKR